MTRTSFSVAHAAESSGQCGKPRRARSAWLSAVAGALAVPALLTTPLAAVQAQTPAAGEEYTTSGQPQLPSKFAAAIIATGNTDKATLNVDGQSQAVHTALLSWPGSELADAGSLIVNKPNNYPRVNGKGEPGWDTFVPRLAAISRVSGGWSVVTIRFVAPADGPAAVITLKGADDTAIRDGIGKRLDAFRQRMTGLSSSSRAGSYFPAARVPARLPEVQQAMADYGNAERKTAGFRRTVGAKVATNIDMRPASITSKEGLEEFVFPQADLVLDDKLNEAAQYFAEALATGNGSVHDGPAQWTDPTGKVVSMRTLGDRFSYFGAVGGAEIATGDGGSALGEFPFQWMAGDTHYRWFWGVDGRYTRIGYGAAQDANGRWHYVGTVRNDGALCAAPPQPADSPCIRRR